MLREAGSIGKRKLRGQQVSTRRLQADRIGLLRLPCATEGVRLRVQQSARLNSG